jgi:hypothetical protein
MSWLVRLDIEPPLETMNFEGKKAHKRSPVETTHGRSEGNSLSKQNRSREEYGILHPARRGGGSSVPAFL